MDPWLSQNGYEFTIDKDFPLGGRIGQLEAIDPDLYSYGEFRFKITDRSTPFSLDMESGDLFLKKKLKDSVVEYKLNVMVFDLGADSKSSKTTVEIKIKQNIKRYPFRQEKWSKSIARGHIGFTNFGLYFTSNLFDQK